MALLTSQTHLWPRAAASSKLTAGIGWPGKLYVHNLTSLAQ